MKKGRKLILLSFICTLIFIIFTNYHNLNSSNHDNEPINTYSPKIAMYGNPRIEPTVPPNIYLNSNMTPFINAHENGARPNGLDWSAPWGYGTVIRNDIKSNWTRIGLWGQVYLQLGYKSLPSNAAIELTNFKQYIYNPNSKQWDLFHDVLFNNENTLFYDDNFENDMRMQFYDNKKILNNGKSVVIRWTNTNKDFNFHPYSLEKKDFVNNGYAINNGIPYVISTLDARLVKWDENGIDDLDDAEFIFNVGGDYWDTYSEMWTSNWTANGEVGGGQFRKVTRDWKTAWFTNVPEYLCDELIPNTFTSK